MIKAITLELLVSSLSRAFISSGDIVGGATEGAACPAAAMVELCVGKGDDVDFEYLAMTLASSGALAPSTRSTTVPSYVECVCTGNDHGQVRIKSATTPTAQPCNVRRARLAVA